MAGGIQFEVDLRDFGQKLQLLANATRRTLGEVIRDQARLTVRDLIKSTPPHGTRPIQEAWTFQRHKGEMTIATDVKRLYSDAQSIRAIMSPTGLSNKARNMRRWYLRTLAEQGRWERVTEALFAMKVTDTRLPIIGQLDETAYRAKWSKWQRRGRVPKNVQDSTFVWDGGTISTVIKQIQARVGWAKAGWLPAATALKLKRLPTWITRHGRGAGSFQDETEDNDRPSFSMTNEVGYIAYLNAGGRLVNRALANRQRAIDISTEHAIENCVDKLKHLFE